MTINKSPSGVAINVDGTLKQVNINDATAADLVVTPAAFTDIPLSLISVTMAPGDQLTQLINVLFRAANVGGTTYQFRLMQSINGAAFSQADLLSAAFTEAALDDRQVTLFAAYQNNTALQQIVQYKLQAQVAAGTLTVLGASAPSLTTLYH